MKPIRYLQLLFLACFLGQPLFASASAQHATLKPVDNSNVKLESYVNNFVFTGTIKQVSGTVVLVTSESTYLLSGGDFTAIVNRQVNVIGKVVAEGSVEKIIVSKIQLAQR